MLLFDADSDSLASLRVQSRESQDPYINLEELISHLIVLLDRRPSYDWQELIKGLYQLQDAIGLPEPALHACLQSIIVDLQKLGFLGEAVGEVEIIYAGDYFDSKKMWPLTPGIRVRQPLGIVIHNQDGEIISKAKVLCH
jgi:hypothetical protein